jgi:broad specificity phosphatase PhoE
LTLRSSEVIYLLDPRRFSVNIKTLIILVWTFVFVGCQSPVESPPDFPESVFFLVRHAEKADQSDESPLTEVGYIRAANLANLLRDSGVENVYSSDFKRTRDTAAPLANDLGLEVVLYDTQELVELADKLLSSPGRYLVVGHSNTTPELVRLLGGEPGSAIAENEYDRLYMLNHRSGAGTSTVLLRLEPSQEPSVPRQ